VTPPYRDKNNRNIELHIPMMIPATIRTAINVPLGFDSDFWSMVITPLLL